MSLNERIASMVVAVGRENGMKLDQNAVMKRISASSGAYPLTVTEGDSTAGMYYIIYAKDKMSESDVFEELGELDFHVKVRKIKNEKES